MGFAPNARSAQKEQVINPTVNRTASLIPINVWKIVLFMSRLVKDTDLKVFLIPENLRAHRSVFFVILFA
jgi:hypothetical protein